MKIRFRFQLLTHPYLIKKYLFVIILMTYNLSTILWARSFRRILECLNMFFWWRTLTIIIQKRNRCCVYLPHANIPWLDYYIWWLWLFDHYHFQLLLQSNPSRILVHSSVVQRIILRGNCINIEQRKCRFILSLKNF